MKATLKELKAKAIEAKTKYQESFGTDQDIDSLEKELWKAEWDLDLKKKIPVAKRNNQIITANPPNINYLMTGTIKLAWSPKTKEARLYYDDGSYHSAQLEWLQENYFSNVAEIQRQNKDVKPIGFYVETISKPVPE